MTGPSSCNSEGEREGEKEKREREEKRGRGGRKVIETAKDYNSPF